MSVGRKPVTFQNVTGIAAGLIKNLVLCARVYASAVYYYYYYYYY